MLVLPTATYRASAFLRAAATLDIDVVVASDEAPTLSARMEGRVLALEIGRPEEAAERAAGFAQRWPVDAVVGVDEASVLVAAHLAVRLGVERNSVGAVAATRDKRRMRALLSAGRVPQPDWVEARSDGTGSGAAAAAERVGLPCVVKPVDLAGSRGVIRADTVDGLAAAIGRVDALLRRPGVCAVEGEPPLLVEKFIPGPEIAIEALLRDGELCVLAIFDKPDPLDGPFFADTLYVTPSRHHPAVLDDAVAVTTRAVAAIGLRNGPVHAELRLTPSGAVFLEVAARSIGGRCSSALTLVDGSMEMSLEEAILRQACGLPLGRPRLAPGGAGVLMLEVPAAGILRTVSGTAAASAVPGVTLVDITIPPGQRVEPLPEGDRYLGFIVARAVDASAVEATLRTAWGHIDVQVER